VSFVEMKNCNCEYYSIVACKVMDILWVVMI